jgi:hypothetical protein
MLRSVDRQKLSYVLTRLSSVMLRSVDRQKLSYV